MKGELAMTKNTAIRGISKFSVFGREIEPLRVGGVIRFDKYPSRILLEGAEYVDESFPGSQFCLSSNYVRLGVPVNVEITGQTLQRWDDDLWVRCRVEFVGDGEPSKFEWGWLKVI